MRCRVASKEETLKEYDTSEKYYDENIDRVLKFFHKDGR